MGTGNKPPLSSSSTPRTVVAKEAHNDPRLALPIRHHLTIDVEEFFHASALENVLPRGRWDSLPRHSPELVAGLLDHLEQSGARATFFVLGWLAEREPDMVRAISRAGHEISSHGWDHRRVTTLSPEEFQEDVRRSRGLLQDLAAQSILGYRAPSFSILPGFEWALDILLEEGFQYDSSMYPVRVHPGYGYPDAERDPHIISRPSGSLAELPPATLKVGSLNLPAAGGAYLRFFPAGLISRALASAERRGVPGTVYLHPWELDESMPPFNAPWRTRLRMRGGIAGMARKLSRLTDRFRFRPMRETAEEILVSVKGGPV
jgi:polysaccharide deacetylase family protein (PEP-CTERM system associated)